MGLGYNFPLASQAVLHQMVLRLTTQTHSQPPIRWAGGILKPCVETGNTLPAWVGAGTLEQPAWVEATQTGAKRHILCQTGGKAG